jgi:MPBQ/MSBQ methyltransferase
MEKIEKSKVRVQPVLKLYLDLSKTNYLHFGLWEAGDKLTLENAQKAQERYADTLVSFIPKGVNTILDVGCGVGGNAIKLANLGYQVTGICPDPYQEQLFGKITKGKAKFQLTTLEKFKSDKQYDMILMSESVQYIPFKEGYAKINKLLKNDGYLLISDYFKKETSRETKNIPSEPVNDYLKAMDEAGFELVKELDITEAILPTLDYGTNIFYDYIKPVLDCVLTTLQVHLPPIHWMLNMFFKIPVKGKSIKQIIKNNLVPMEKSFFRQHFNYKIMLIKRKKA